MVANALCEVRSAVSALVDVCAFGVNASGVKGDGAAEDSLVVAANGGKPTVAVEAAASCASRSASCSSASSRQSRLSKEFCLGDRPRLPKNDGQTMFLTESTLL